MPDWDPAEECKVVTSDDDVAANPLYNACLAKERASYQTLEAKRDGIADAQWRECMAIAEIEKSFTLLLDCLQDSPTAP